MKFSATLAAVGAATAAANPLHNTPLNIPTITIAPTVEMPMQGLGTWEYNDTVAGAAVAMALEMGYTHIVSAPLMFNRGK
jgi:hypothetical protein